MEVKLKYFNIKTKELNDADIIEGIETALQNYKDGEILECRDELEKIVSAITKYEKVYW